MKIFLGFFLLFLPFASYPTSVQKNQIIGTQSSTSTLRLLAPQGKRTKVIFYNYGPGSAVLKWSSASTTSSDGFNIGSGEGYFDTNPPADSFYLKVPSGDVEYYIYEASDF